MRYASREFYLSEIWFSLGMISAPRNSVSPLANCQSLAFWSDLAFHDCLDCCSQSSPRFAWLIGTQARDLPSLEYSCCQVFFSFCSPKDWKKYRNHCASGRHCSLSMHFVWHGESCALFDWNFDSQLIARLIEIVPPELQFLLVCLGQKLL